MKDREGVTKNYLTVWPFDQHELHSIGMRKSPKAYKYKIYNQLQYFFTIFSQTNPRKILGQTYFTLMIIFWKYSLHLRVFALKTSTS